MKVNDKKRAHPPNKRLFAIVCAACVAALAVVVAVVLFLQNQPAGGEGGGTEGDKLMKIATPYCEMKYPTDYEDFLEIKEFSENGIYTKQFLCTLSVGQRKLFAVHFGEGASGDFFGYLTAKEGRVSVYIECYTQEDLDALPEEDRRTYYYMMDGINEIAKSIAATAGYADH